MTQIENRLKYRTLRAYRIKRKANARHKNGFAKGPAHQSNRIGNMLWRARTTPQQREEAYQEVKRLRIKHGIRRFSIQSPVERDKIAVMRFYRVSRKSVTLARTKQENSDG